jgi:phosphoglycolate phosphatase
MGEEIMAKVLSDKVGAVFFDFEGTVVDFQWKLAVAVDETLTALNMAGFSKDLFGTTPGYASIYNKTVELSSKDNAYIKTVDSIYDRYDQDALTRWQRYDDTIDVLSDLKQKKYPIGMISNVGNTALMAALTKLDIRGYFDVVTSRDEMTRIKPDPEGLLMAAQTLHLAPARILFVGDSRNDVIAAHAAGMASCYLVGGEDTPEQLASFSPNLTIRKLGQLSELLGNVA